VIENVEQVEQIIRDTSSPVPSLLYLLYRYSTRYRSYPIQNRRHSIYSIDLGVGQSLGRSAHLAFAAFLAISRRLRADRALARAGPPALPPMRAIWDRSSDDRDLMRDFPPRLPISDRNSRTAAGVGDLGFLAIGSGATSSKKGITEKYST
jgi:hypothetical protein